MKKDNRPNFLLIMPDQMRADCLSLEGHTALLTPVIDSIGGQGAWFTRAYTTCASCIPARRSLLTGLFPAHNGVVGYQEGIPIKDPTLVQRLRDAGYATMLAGRYMHQSPYEAHYGYEREIRGSTHIIGDEYDQMLSRAIPEFGEIRRGIGLSANSWQARPWPLPEHLHPTNWTIQQGRRLLRQHADKRPVFLALSFFAPHPPLVPPAFYMERYLEMDLPEPAIGSWAVMPPREGLGAEVESHHVCLHGEGLRRAQAGYFGLINHLDDLLFTFLYEEFIRLSNEQRRPWVVFFTSDHGEMLGDHYLFRKCEPYEGASRIPFLVRASNDLGFVSGLIFDKPVCLEDIMPTVLDLAGVDVPSHIDGKSLIAVLRGSNTAPHDWLHGEHAPCYDAEQAYHFLTDGQIKYIWRPHSGTEQLFDLKRDPRELNDVSEDSDYSAVLAACRARLIRIIKDRPEGFTDGRVLIPGRPYSAVLPQARL